MSKATNKNDTNKNEKIHITSIGGQAVMEGVMMRGPKTIATAVRKADGSIIVDKKDVNSVISKYKLLNSQLFRQEFCTFIS